jgi:zinc transport system substrate-binding protein
MLRRLAPLLVLLLAVPVSACGASSDSGRPQVIASFYPLQYVAGRIVGDHAEVSNLTAPGVEPHDLELSPRQAASLSGAEVVLYEKGLQPAVDEAVKNDSPKASLDAASVVKLHETAGHDAEEKEEGNDHGGVDPHFWQDPTLLAKVADAFAKKMSDVDPDHAADYEKNNAALQQDLKSLDADYVAGLKTCTTRTLVVSHDAFEYLGERYDLEVHPIAGLSPDAEPSAQHLKDLGDLIRSDKITTVFNERLASPKLADSLASDLGITTAVLDPIEGLTSKNKSDDYLSIMRANLAAIQKADSCT